MSFREALMKESGPEDMVFEFTNADKKEIADMINNLAPPPDYKPKVVMRTVPDKDIKTAPAELFTIKFQLTEQQLSEVRKLMGTYKFAYSPQKPHDHPITHIVASASEKLLFKDLLGLKVIDIDGKEFQNQQLKNQVTTVVALRTGKDYSRRAKENLARMKNPLLSKPTTFGAVAEIIENYPEHRIFTMNHTLYDYSVDDIGQICNAHPDNIVKAIVHRFDKMEGTLNCGELKYTVNPEGYVTRNTPNGETYVTKTTEPYFRQMRECHTKFGYISWTIDTLFGDTYLITFNPCPGFSPSYHVEPLAMPTQQVNTQPIIVQESKHFVTNHLFGYTWLTSKESDVKLKDIALFNDLQRYVVGRERNINTMMDLTHYCRRLCDKRDLFSKHGDKHYDILPEMMPWYIQAAFYHGITNENDAMLSTRRAHVDAVSLNGKLRNDLSYSESTFTNRMKAQHETASRITKPVTDNIAKGVSALMSGERQTITELLEKQHFDYD